MRNREKLSLVTIVLVMALVLMMSVTINAAENLETGGTGNIMNVLKGALGKVDLSGLEVNGVNLGTVDLGGIDLGGIDLKGGNVGVEGLKDADLKGKPEEYLKSLGYSDEDIAKLKATLSESFNEKVTAVVNAALTGKETGEAADAEILQETAPEPEIYVVKRGDNLSKIAKKMYGDSSKWTVIYNLNRDQIRDPNRIEIGQRLIIA
ncbi:MAG: LysM peptidoglycan-binding domain-containing protein [Lachnospiraceae bacterium]|jgi:hypothetical protein|nr:LysM peptidoglycan-binding domain-containing protein [Lachnospiraceae bacterium]